MSNQQTACMHVAYFKNKHDRTSDALVVKERIRDPLTGEEKPNIKIIRDYQRPFWITKKPYRDHKEKREWEYVDKLQYFECNQAQLPRKVANQLGVHKDFIKMKELCRSPYVYGTDIAPEVIYKVNEDARFEKEVDGWRPDMSIAVADYETDMVHGHEQIISGALHYDNQVFIVSSAEFLGFKFSGDKELDKKNLDALTRVQKAKLMELADKHLMKHVANKNLEIKFKIVPGAYNVAKTIMMCAHKLMPDLLAFWNMDFDVSKMIEACERAGKDETSIFCDPRIPEDLKTFYYKQDQIKRKKADGTEHSNHPADLWHVVQAPASFYIIDAMCVFRKLRVVEGMRQSFSLDAILKDENVGGKLTFGETHGHQGAAMHRHMQKEMKIEYLLYMGYDCIGVNDLDNKTKDLAKKIGAYADGSSLGALSSNPRRLCNGLFFYLLESGRVPCATSDQMEHPDDAYVIDRKDWIVTLANELATKPGIRVFGEEFGEFISRIATHVADIDITSGYPRTQYVTNMSNSTKLVETCAIDGLNTDELKRLGVDMTNVPANAVSICQRVLKAPTMDYWTKVIEEEFDQAA